MNFRLAILIAIGPSIGGHAHWITAHHSTPGLAGLCPTSRGPDAEKLTVFLRCEVTRLARCVHLVRRSDMFGVEAQADIARRS